LPKLQILDISRNKLSRVPEEIKNMKALRVMSIMHNSIESVPLVIGSIENLHIFKIGGNPLNKALQSILDESDASPPAGSSTNDDNERSALLTHKIKEYLRSEAARLESGDESRLVKRCSFSMSFSPGYSDLNESSESPLDTPRPLRRNTSSRFPVIPATSGSESAPDPKSPGLFKLSGQARLHNRTGSSQNFGFHGALRRPAIAPLMMRNDRYRSNSESVLQATQNMRARRMGVVTKRTPELKTVAETRSNRNSFHFRGMSHASVLRDKSSSALGNGLKGGASNPTSPIDIDRVQGRRIRPLSSVPEIRDETGPGDGIVEGAKSLLYSLYQLHAQLGSLLAVIPESASKRASLERVYENASTHLARLDLEIRMHDTDSDQPRRRKGHPTRKVKSACQTCIDAYEQVGLLYVDNVTQLTERGDRRYLRTLMSLTFGSAREVRNGHRNLAKAILTTAAMSIKSSDQPPPERLPTLAVLPVASMAGEAAVQSRRMKADAALSKSRSNSQAKNAGNPRSAVPLYINGRSRSNSRTSTFASSAASSIANTPMSAESFLIPETPATMPTLDRSLLPAALPERDETIIFERIYIDFSKAVNDGHYSLPIVQAHFDRGLETAQAQYANRAIIDVWSRLIDRCRQCLEACEVLKERLSHVKLNDPEIRYSADFWKCCTRVANSFLTLANLMKEAKELRLIQSDTQRMVKPLFLSIKQAVNSIKNSPWFQLFMSPSSTPLQQSIGGAPPWPGIASKRSLSKSRYGLANGHHRTRGDSGSGSSPYLPTTPLLAALGVAAQATIPSTPSSSMSALDRSFQGDVFQRAEACLSMQSTVHRR
jgi:hypothetical protein